MVHSQVLDSKTHSMNVLRERFIPKVVNKVEETVLEAADTAKIFSYDHSGNFVSSVYFSLRRSSETNPAALDFIAGFTILVSGAYLLDKPSRRLGIFIGRLLR